MLFVIVRFTFERYIALNLCVYIGIVGKSRNRSNGRECTDVNGDTVPLTNNKKTQGVRFVHKGRMDNSDTKFYKATETCWRCFIYFALFVYGTYCVLGSNWFYQSSWNECALAKQMLPEELKWYIILELSFYVSLLITQFNDTKRKDLWQQVVHHITTIILIAACYIIAHFYVGMVIMWLHDTADWLLEGAKLAKYAKKQRLCDVVFVVFAIVFYISRWVYFPFYVLPHYATNNPSLVGPSKLTWPWLFWYMCFILMVLHYYWGYLIARMIYKFVNAGKVAKDDRSDDEDGDSSAQD
jgi:hypothetical protein